MALNIESLTLRAATPEGEFGSTLTFDPGLNVVRAENTSGKSTCVMGIVYALGLEGAFSAQNEPPLPPAMTEALEYRGRNYAVLESSIEVALSNGQGKRILVKRPVKTAGDRRLIAVTESEGLRRDYYVRVEGAARRERGFHAYLAEFVGWTLPEVPRYDDRTALLNMECLVPFFVVEQKAGWSQMEPKLPTRYGIRDMQARSVEFLLDLETQDSARVRAELRSKAERISEEWSRLLAGLAERARREGGSLREYPTRPSGLFPTPETAVVFPQQDLVRTLADEAAAVRDSLEKTRELPVPTAGEVAGEATQQLKEAERAFSEVDATYKEALNDLESERALNRSLEQRLEELAEDLHRYKDLARIKSYGSTEAIKSWKGICPTCHQKVADSLVANSASVDPMSVDENIAFIEAQRGAFQATKSSSDASLAEKEARNASIMAVATESREKIRALKETLLSASSMPSIDSVREIVMLEQRTASLEALAIDEMGIRGQLEELGAEWTKVQASLKALQGGGSDADKEKIAIWSRSVRSQLQEYGFKSVGEKGIDVSWGSFKLEYDGSAFERAISASDMIRCHWAYLLGLLEVARQRHTNHPRLLLLDEPKQQSAAEYSFAALLARSAQTAGKDSQIILATSEPMKSLTPMLSSLPHKLRDFEMEKVLQPVPK